MTNNSAKYGSATGCVASWAPVFIGFALGGPVGAIGGMFIGDRLARKIDLGTSSGKYIDEK